MIDTVINDLQAIANAFTSVETFIYDRVSAMNENRTKEYPVILVDSNPTLRRGEVNNEFLPRFKEYDLRIFVYDLYQDAEKGTTNLQTKQAEVELILDQYIAEIISRTQASAARGYFITDFKHGIKGILAKDVHNNKLIQASYNITVKVNTQCTDGEFEAPTDCPSLCELISDSTATQINTCLSTAQRDALSDIISGDCTYDVYFNGVLQGSITASNCEDINISLT